MTHLQVILEWNQKNQLVNMQKLRLLWSSIWKLIWQFWKRSTAPLNLAALDGRFPLTNPETRVDFILLNTTRRKIKMSSKLYVKLHSQHSQLFGQRATLLAQSHPQRMDNAQNHVIGHCVIAISGARPASAVGTLTFSEVAIHK